MALEPLKIRVDQSEVRAIYDDLAHIKSGAPRAMSRAINHTLGVTRTESSSEIRKQVKLKAGYVRDKLKVRKATVSKVQGAIQTPSRGSMLSRYPHTEYKRGGMGVQVKPNGGKQKMPGAFAVNFINRNRQTGEPTVVKAIVYRPNDPSKVNWKRTGLRVTRGPSLSQVFAGVKDDLQAPSGNRLMQRMAYEADRLLAKQ